MKKFLALILAVCLVLSMGMTPVLASESEDSAAIHSGENNITPVIVVHYDVTIERVYNTYAEILQYVNFSEYNPSYGVVFSGTLSLRSAVQQSNGTWLATYSGPLFGQI